MSRAMKISLVLALLGVAAGAIYLRGLHEEVLRLARPQQSEEQVRREITQPPMPAPASNKEKAKIFWAAEGGTTLEPVEVELALSADASQRAKQLMLTLIAAPPKPEQRTLPADAALLELYVLEDGTTIADFSDVLARATPSGVQSEQLALESILRTLQANVPEIRRVKILINGQETDTLAGHVDLTGYFELRAAPESKPALTQSEPPGKLERHQ
jgi:spore germination protein GerM